MKKRTEFIEKDILLELYINQNKNIEEICELLNTTKWDIRVSLKHHNIVKSNELVKLCRKNTTLKIYGVENPSQSEVVKKEKIANSLQKYGVSHPSKLQITTYKRKTTCLEKYGCEASSQSSFVKQKVKANNQLKYNVDYPSQLKDIKEKVISQNRHKYGVDHPSQTKEFQDKRKDTCMNKYGGYAPICDRAIKSKIKNTCLSKYGVDNPAKSNLIRYKMHQTCLQKYGVSNPFQKEDIREKAFNTMRKNNSFKTSTQEEIIYNRLCDIFSSDNIVRQYKDKNKYPFNCDFYIKSLNLFIECNYYWGHGLHPYNDNNEEDVRLKNIWLIKSHEHKIYEEAIKIWTVKDVEKLNILKRNKLNFILIYPNNLIICSDGLSYSDICKKLVLN